MAEVPPYQKLEPNAQPWGRWVTERTASNVSAIESLRTNQKAQGESVAAQLNRLQEQIADLSERRSYSVAIPGSLVTTTPSAYVSYSGSDRIDFTLRRDSMVRVSGSAALSGFSNGGNSGVAGSFGVYIDTPWLPYPSPEQSRFTGFSSTSVSAGNVSHDASVGFASTIRLSAGQHFVRPHAIDCYVSIQGTSGSASLENMFFSVDVLGLA